MTTRKPVPFFLSKTGRKLTFGAITTSALACTLAKFAPHTFCLQQYKDFVHYYNNGKQVDLSKELVDRCQKCLDILNTSDVHRKLITPFSVFGFDLFHAGSTSSKFGVAIGIPVNFTYKSFSDIEKDNIQVNQNKIDWESENGKKLAESMILTEKVQQFAICREILMTHNNKVLFESVYPFTCIYFAYNTTSYLNTKLNLYSAHPSLRYVMYTIVGFFSLGLYFLMKDMTEVYYESQVDKKLCELGKDFVESGVIFYDKLLKRNQALRELMGDEGKRKYSKLGNENFFLRQPRIALVHRKTFFEEKLKEIQNTSL